MLLFSILIQWIKYIILVYIVCEVIWLKIKWKTLIVSIAIPLLVGGLSALVTRNSMEDFKSLQKPPLSPPGWLFPIVWTILFVLMGIASYLVYTSTAPAEEKKKALQIYAIQLFFNFFWSILFFNLQTYSFSFVWLVALLILILSTTLAFWRISKPTGYLLIPYIIWVTFAGYLNLSIAFLNWNCEKRRQIKQNLKF